MPRACWGDKCIAGGLCSIDRGEDPGHRQGTAGPRPIEKGRIMLDLIIRGGDVVTPQGVGTCDVVIKGETIAAVTAPGVW